MGEDLFKDLILIDTKTGKELIVSSITDNLVIEHQLSVDVKPNISFSMDNVKFSTQANQMLFGENPKNYRMEMEGYRSVYVQARKKKKKRVNKKWLKKYGYREVQIPVKLALNDCIIEQDDFNTYTYTVSGKL